MQEKRTASLLLRAHAAAVVLLAGGTAIDVGGVIAALPVTAYVWSYVLVATAVGVGCIVVLGRMLLLRRATSDRVPRLADLTALGVALVAWLLRGHPEIPTDPPLAGAEFVALLILAATATRRLRGPGTSFSQ